MNNQTLIESDYDSMLTLKNTKESYMSKLSFKPKNYVFFIFLLLSFTSVSKPLELSWENLSQEEYVDNLVACQYEIKKLQWSHSIWPKENKIKPLFSEITDKKTIRNQAIRNLQKQTLLFEKFNIEITGAMLQSDINRMVRNTRDNKKLKELFALLNNDPISITQCISRPYLVKTKISNSFNRDKTIHQNRRQLAQSEMIDYISLKKLTPFNANISFVTYSIKESNNKNNDSKSNAHVQEQELIVSISPEEYKNKINNSSIKGLQERGTYFIYSEVADKKGDNLKIKHLVWEKQKLDEWIDTQYEIEIASPIITSKLVIPNIKKSDEGFDYKSDSSLGDYWKLKNIPEGRYEHTSIWTGSEMIIWGGYVGGATNSGGRYNPVNDSWVATSFINAPDPRHLHSAVWTGSKMIIWGGRTNEYTYTNTGSVYDPNLDKWTTINTQDTPSTRGRHTATWTGLDMIVWGGYNGTDYLSTGGRYNLQNDIWQPTSSVNSPQGRINHTSVWTGSEMIVWGGYYSENNVRYYLNTGSRYNPNSDNWLSTDLQNAPSNREHHTAVWTGSEMIVWGGTTYSGGDIYHNTGGKYNPVSNSWNFVSTINAPIGRSLHTAIWTGSKMFVWSGDIDYLSFTETGGLYNPENNSWQPTSVTSAPTGRRNHTLIWTGDEAIVWGGGYGGSSLNTGGRYNPDSDNWIDTKTDYAPSSRFGHSAIWTGNEMIIWGGTNINNGAEQSGGKYNLTTDTWVSTNIIGAPSKRSGHTAIWTGAEMIVWGGSSEGNSNFQNSGSLYSPFNDSWQEITLINAPIGRNKSSAVWTGTEMIVWGGSYYDGDTIYLNSGGRYNLSNDEWLATSIDNSASKRALHSAIWTGSEMIVFGGWDGTNSLNTGSRYNPVDDTWLQVNSLNAPFSNNQSVWTGNKMIVWGGDTGSLSNTGGIYDPLSDNWNSISNVNAPISRYLHNLIWTGKRMLVWGGQDGSFTNNFISGGSYDPLNDNWEEISELGAPNGRMFYSSIWTGQKMVVWGGIQYNYNKYINTGGVYIPKITDVIFTNSFEHD